jgi:DNA-directed RNA polymerase subunit RPC12/RpoP
MSATILPFAKPAPAQAAEGPRYFCTRCDADEFKLYEIGTANCARCGARISNLSVSDGNRPAA